MNSKQTIRPGQPECRDALSRRRFLQNTAVCAATIGLGGGTGMLPGSAHAAIGEAAPLQEQFVFDVLKDGERIGAHRLNIKQDGSQMLVDVRVRVKVRVGFLTAFSYSHTDHEVWDGQRLVSLNASTTDNGAEQFVTAHAGDGGLVVTSSSGEYLAPADIMSSSYWRFETVRQRSLLNTQTGRLTDIHAVDCGVDDLRFHGMDVAARRFRLSGQKMKCDVWYGVKNGQWLGLAFATHGAQINYRPREETVISAL